ncbi:MAG: heavy metal translocating P-type ATPase [Treponema sp.]|nr:heavy metal translocating P-type ATPase [Treponema sp.]
MISGYFVWAVLAVATVTLLGWLVSGAGFASALEFALAVLVIACPCALGLATPIAVIVGIGRGARSGILIKSGAVLESAGKISAVVFDKTGTLTIGKPEVNAVRPLAAFSENKLLAAAAAEKHSSHPLAEAVVREAESRQLELPEATQFEDRPGYGVTALIGGTKWLFGNARLLKETGIDPEAFSVSKLPEGVSLIYAAADGIPAGLLAIGDRLKPGAAEAVERLNALGIATIMLTGDNLPAAKAMAEKLHLASFRAELLPGDKAGIIRELQGGTPRRVVAMVGDGINDAPALAQADVGIAIGSGTDVAMESADVVLMRDGLDAVPAAIELSRATMRIIRQNLFWAFFYNAVGIPLAAGVFYTLLHWKLSPVLGAAAMAASSVTVVLNALRLRRVRL